MSKNMSGRDVQLVQKVTEVFCHRIVRHDFGMRGSAVIALVNSQDSERAGEYLAERMPIVQRT
jgi:hypothetical protein